ncbi:MAG: VPLPA-CTERM sorting domain-containing protein [Pseudomonadota bacterium]
MKAFGRKARRSTLAVAGAAVVAAAGSDAGAVVIIDTPDQVLPTDGSVFSLNVDGKGPAELGFQFVSIKGMMGNAFDIFSTVAKAKGPPLGGVTPEPVDPGTTISSSTSFDLETQFDGPDFPFEGSSLFFGIEFRNMGGDPFLNGWIELVLEKAGMMGAKGAGMVFPTITLATVAFETDGGPITVPAPVPLPAAGPLALLGLGGLALFRRRRREK